MKFAIVFIISALVLYTTAIWSEQCCKSLKKWMVIVFALGLSCDATGTTIMGFYSQGITCNTHSIYGFTALFIMTAHLYWAVMSLRNKGRMEKTFHRFSPYAWLIWLVAFSTGIPK